MITESIEPMYFLKRPTDVTLANIEAMLIHNHNILYATRILLVLLWSYPANRYFNFNNLVNNTPKGAEEVSDAVQDALNIGALVIDEKARQWELISPKKWMV